MLLHEIHCSLIGVELWFLVSTRLRVTEGNVKRTVCQVYDSVGSNSTAGSFQTVGSRKPILNSDHGSPKMSAVRSGGPFEVDSRRSVKYARSSTNLAMPPKLSMLFVNMKTPSPETLPIVGLRA